MPQNGDIVLLKRSIGGKTNFFMVENMTPERHDRVLLPEEDGIARLAVQHASRIPNAIMDEESRLP